MVEAVLYGQTPVVYLEPHLNHFLTRTCFAQKVENWMVFEELGATVLPPKISTGFNALRVYSLWVLNGRTYVGSRRNTTVYRLEDTENFLNSGCDFEIPSGTLRFPTANSKPHLILPNGEETDFDLSTLSPYDEIEGKQHALYY